MNTRLWPFLYALNAAALFAGASIYFGTGWSTAIFQFPVMPLLTLENYSLHFIPQIDAATNFFTFLVTMMLTTATIMLIVEWRRRTRYRWVPVAMILLVVGATCLTVFVVFPVNDILRKGITDQAVLMRTVGRWVELTKVRVVIWSAEWACMMYYFGRKAFGEPDPADLRASAAREVSQ